MTAADRATRSTPLTDHRPPAHDPALWVTNVATPYRRPVWEAMGASRALTVGLVESAEHTRREGRRGDDFVAREAGPFTVSELATARVQGGENARFLLTGTRGLPRPRPRRILLGGWDQPAYWQLLLGARLRGARVVGFYESTLLTHHHDGGPIAAARRTFFRALDAVVVPGVAAEDAVRAMGVDPARIYRGFNAVDVRAFHDAAARARATGVAAEHAFVYVGQLIARKNVDQLLRALAALDTGTLLVVGGGPLRADLEALAAELGVRDRVEFQAPVPNAELAATLARARTLVLPSTEEVWGLVVNEALAAGLHAVVTEGAGVAPSVAGMAGVHLAAPEADALAAAMRASEQLWVGPVEQPEILRHTPEAFADVFAAALDGRPAPRRPAARTGRDVRLALVADGPPDSPQTNSGVARGVSQALARTDGIDLVLAQGTRPGRLGEAWIRLRAFRLPVTAWRHASHHSPTARRLISRQRDRVMRSAATPPDLLLHVRNTYTPAPVPYAAFVDTTSEISRRWDAWAASADTLFEAERAYFRGAALVFTAGREAATSVIEDYGVEPSRVHAVGGGTNFDRSRMPEPPARPSGTMRVLFVGLDHRRKGGDALAHAISALRARGVDVEATVITRDTPPGSDGVTVRPPVWDREELSRVYAEHDVFCLPALHEPYGLVVQEAMAHGLPAVVSDVGALPDIVEDGVTGRVCAGAGDGTAALAEALVAAIGELAADPEGRATMGRAAQERAFTEFTWEAVAARMQAAIDGWWRGA